jgi:hypothetical protein
MLDPAPKPPVPGLAVPITRPSSRTRRVVLILILTPIAFVLSPLILFVTVCALLVRK